MGGGGSTGKIDFPTYMKQTHKAFLGDRFGSLRNFMPDYPYILETTLEKEPFKTKRYPDPRLTFNTASRAR